MNELVVAITGAIKESNFDEYKLQLLESIKGKDIDLVSDSDFVHASEVVKACTDGEKAIKESKALAVAGMADVNALFEAMDEISAELRKTRLSLSKKITTQKATQKQLAIDSAEIFITDFVESMDIPSFGVISGRMCQEAAVAIQESTRGRSSLDKIKEVTMDTAVEYVGKLSELSLLVKDNMAYLAECDADTMTIFHDKNRLLGKDAETFKDIVDTRLIGHKADVKAKELAKQERERKQKEYDDAAKANQNKRDEAAVGENLNKPTVAVPQEVQQAKRAGMNWVITISLSGELDDASEAARMVKAVLEDTECVTDITLNRV